MHRLPLLLAGLTACGNLQHINPAPRTDVQQRLALVRVHSDCVEDLLTPPPGMNAEIAAILGVHDTKEWFPSKFSTGVVISEAHVVTAGHAVTCPVIPAVTATSTRGTFSMLVEREENNFGDGRDLARLRMTAAYDRFGVNVAPPLLGPPPAAGDVVCVDILRNKTAQTSCGEALSRHAARIPTQSGDSGAPVYDVQGRLLGIVVRGNGVDTVWEQIDPTFLQGT